MQGYSLELIGGQSGGGSTSILCVNIDRDRKSDKDMNCWEICARVEPGEGGEFKPSRSSDPESVETSLLKSIQCSAKSSASTKENLTGGCSRACNWPSRDGYLLLRVEASLTLRLP